jgi:hydrogenase maturation protease
MTSAPVRCLILACGNTLRGDDGVGPWLCAWAEERFASDPNVRALSRQQWTPELAAEIAEVESVLFIDCSVESAPGIVRMTPVEPHAAGPGLATHHIGAAELLALSQELYGSLPQHALLLTMGAGSTELGDMFSQVVTAALPEACRLLESSVHQFLTSPAPDQCA